MRGVQQPDLDGVVAEHAQGDQRKPNPYLSVEELASVTPWTEDAIRSMIKRGDFVDGEHFFRVGRRVFFKWSAVVDMIEHRSPKPLGTVPLQRARHHEPPQA